jgi:hypothetical protein
MVKTRLAFVVTLAWLKRTPWSGIYRMQGTASLESDQLDDVKVDGQQCVVDRGGQISLIPALFAKQLVQSH